MHPRAPALLLALILPACDEAAAVLPDAPTARPDAHRIDAEGPDALAVDASAADAAAPRRCVRVSVSTSGAQTNGPSYVGMAEGVHRYLTTDGAVIAFQSEGALAADDTDTLQDIYLRDPTAATTTRVSVASTGAPAGARSVGLALSGDGRFVAFHSDSSALVPGDSNGVDDVFVHDRVLHETERVSVSSDETQANCGSYRPSLSADGRFVAFDSCTTSWAEVAGKTLAVLDVFVRDRLTGTTILVSTHPLGDPGARWDHHSTDPVLSADGAVVAFASRSSTIADKGGTSTSSEIYAHALATGANEWVSRHGPLLGQPPDSFHPSVSGAGRHVAYESVETTQVAGDGNQDRDIFVRDRQTGVTERVNVSSTGAEAQELGTTTGQGSHTASISDDGRLVAFVSYATNLVGGDGNATRDVFIRDRLLGLTTRVTGDDGAEPDGASEGPSLSGDGQWIAFVSGATNLVVPDTNAITPDFYLCPVP
ncbi:MAG: PD40 domain-containing protein [Myxococcales bacterium]|nr:PD40 domain-containing protein [Myxococcales bacterium]MBP6848338.1 PD40 domain-containing protein [Kofleriaceae bacterium]